MAAAKRSRAMPDTATFAEQGIAEVAAVSGEAFSRMVRDDVQRWARVVKSTGVRVE